MSRMELQRFLGEVRKHPSLLEELKSLGHDAEAALRWLEARGFGVTRQEIAELLAADRELSDDDLEDVAGGDTAWTGGDPPPPTGGT
jgi:predicted ribosomally synthesized peptide with nif11-like leader